MISLSGLDMHSINFNALINYGMNMHKVFELFEIEKKNYSCYYFCIEYGMYNNLVCDSNENHHCCNLKHTNDCTRNKI